MAKSTVTNGAQAPAQQADIAGACAALRAWLQVFEDEQLEASVAQPALLAVDHMLTGWEASTIAARELLMGVKLVQLAERSLFVDMTASADDAVSEDVAALVRRALPLLDHARAASSAKH